MKCPNCGAELARGQTFCTSCGQKMGAVGGVPAPPAGVPAPPPARAPSPVDMPVTAYAAAPPPPRGIYGLPARSRIAVMMLLGVVSAIALVLIFNTISGRIRGIHHFSGKYTDAQRGFSFQIPKKHWREVKLEKPGTGYEYARFFRRNPEALSMRVFVIPSSGGMLPAEIPQEFIDATKSIFEKDVQKILVDDGYTFKLKTVNKQPGLGGRDGVQIRGTAAGEGKSGSRQTRIYIAFQDDFMIYLLFMSGQESDPKAESDIRAIATSFTFN